MTAIILATVLALLVGYDVWAYVTGRADTITTVIRKASAIVPFLTGVLAGHLFWCVVVLAVVTAACGGVFLPPPAPGPVCIQQVTDPDRDKWVNCNCYRLTGAFTWKSWKFRPCPKPSPSPSPAAEVWHDYFTHAEGARAPFCGDVHDGIACDREQGCAWCG